MTAPTQEQGSDTAEKAEAAFRKTSAPKLPAVRSQPAAQVPGAKRFGRRAWVWAICLAVAGGAGLGLYIQPWAAGALPVAVEITAAAPVTRVLAVNGRIAASHSVDVRALIGGTLADVHVATGDVVQQGTVLAGIDAAAQRAAVRQAMAGLDAALLAQAEAGDVFARAEALGDNVARTVRDAAARAAQLAQQDVARAAAMVDQAQVQLELHAIRAPLTGTVLSLNVEPGQSIDPSTVLMTLADLDRLVVEADVDEAYATQMRTGLPAVLQLVGETTTRPGIVSLVSQRVDTATGGLAVELRPDDPVIAPVGLTVTINIIVDSIDAAITAPRAAIQTGDAGDAVFVVVDGTAQRRPVSVIDWPAARLIVTRGLSPGDMLILDATGITDGQAVRVEDR